MKRSYIVLGMSLLTLSACVRKNSRQSVDPKGQIRQGGGAASGETNLPVYDDQEQAFVLDGTASPFAQGHVDGGEAEGIWFEDDEQLSIETIFFAFDQYAISPEQMKAVKRASEQIKKELKQNKDGIIVIHGHACSSAGSWKYNMLLSEQRAQEVKNALVKLGVPADRLKVVGHGFEMPKVVSGTREQQAPNRRVDFSLVVVK